MDHDSGNIYNSIADNEITRIYTYMYENKQNMDLTSCKSYAVFIDGSQKFKLKLISGHSKPLCLNMLTRTNNISLLVV